MHNTIKALSPNAEASDYDLRDDGQGLYFSRWDSEKLGPAPSIADVTPSDLDGGSRFATKRELSILHPDQLYSYMKKLVSQHIDTQAKAADFDSIHSVAKFIGWDNPWRELAESYNHWQVSCWQVAIGAYNAYLADEKAITTGEELIAALPEVPR